MFWTSGFLINAAFAAGNLIKSFEYELNGSWETASIISSGQESGGDAYHVYSCFVFKIPENASGTITGFRVIDASGRVIGSRVENIVKSTGTAMVYKFKLRICEEEK